MSGKMSRRDRMEERKGRLRGILTEMVQERDDAVAQLDDIVAQGSTRAQDLLRETSPEKFFRMWTDVHADVQKCLDRIVLMQLQQDSSQDSPSELMSDGIDASSLQDPLVPIPTSSSPPQQLTPEPTDDLMLCDIPVKAAPLAHSRCLIPQPRLVDFTVAEKEESQVDKPTGACMEEAQIDRPMELHSFKWNMQGKCQAFPGYISSPEEFWLIPSDTSSYDELCRVWERLREDGNSGRLKPLESMPEEGQYVAALTSKGAWYRGQITNVEHDHAMVVDVDHGRVRAPTYESLRQLPKYAYNVNRHAVLCTLRDAKEERPAKVEERFKEIMHSSRKRGVRVELVMMFSNVKSVVDLFTSDGKDVFHMLQEYQTSLFKMQEAVNSNSTNSCKTSPERPDILGQRGGAGDASQEGAAARDWSTLELISTSPPHKPKSPPPNLVMDTFNIPPPQIDAKTTPCVRVIMSHMESPEEFYVHIVDPKFVGIDEMRKELNDFYANSQIPHPNVDELTVGSCWAAKFSDDGLWYRGKVVEVKELMFRMWYVDYGDSGFVRLEDIRPLMPKFWNRDGSVVCMALGGVAPPEPDHSISDEPCWDTDTLTVFQDMTSREGAEIEAYLFDKDKWEAMSNRRVQTVSKLSPIPVLLSVNLQGEEVVVNEALISLGMARRMGLPTLDELTINGESATSEEHSPPGSTNVGPPAMPAFTRTEEVLGAGSLEVESGNAHANNDEDDEFKGWDPMGDDFYSARNNYELDTENAEMALTGYISKDMERICMMYYRRGYCNRRVCDYEHVMPDPTGITRDKAQITVHLPAPKLPHAGTYCSVQVSAIINPASFYIVFPHGQVGLGRMWKNEKMWEDQLKKDCKIYRLQKAMQHQFKNSRITDVTTTPAMGEVLAALNRDDGMWYRVRVNCLTDARGDMNVFSMDYGFSFMVNETDVRHLQPHLNHVPVQAVQCFMSHMKPNGPGWSQKCNDLFYGLVDSKDLIAYIHSRGEELNTLEVDLYDETGTNIAEYLSLSGHAQIQTPAQTVPFRSVDVMHVPG